VIKALALGARAVMIAGAPSLGRGCLRGRGGGLLGARAFRQQSGWDDLSKLDRNVIFRSALERARLFSDDTAALHCKPVTGKRQGALF
jgi:hypothetical protein